MVINKQWRTACKDLRGKARARAKYVRLSFVRVCVFVFLFSIVFEKYIITHNFVPNVDENIYEMTPLSLKSRNVNYIFSGPT